MRTIDRVYKALRKEHKKASLPKRRATKEELNEIRIALNKLLEKFRFQEFRRNKKKQMLSAKHSYSGYYKLEKGHQVTKSK